MVVYMSYGRLVRNFWAPSTKGRGPGGMHSVQNERNGAYVLFNITKCPAKFLRLGCVFDYCFRLFEGQNKEHTL